MAISTWRSVEQWQAWANSTERQAIAATVERLLSTPAKTTILKLLDDRVMYLMLTTLADEGNKTVEENPELIKQVNKEV